MSKKTKHRGELRVAIRDGDRAALAFWARITRKNDLYYGNDPGAGIQVKGSYHASGQEHLYLGRQRTPATQSVPLANFQGKERVLGSSANFDELNWDYSIAADDHRRRTLSVERAELPHDDLQIDFWLGDKTHLDLASEVLSDDQNQLQFAEVVAYAITDWTQPQMLAIVSYIRTEVRESAARGVAEIEKKRAVRDSLWLPRSGTTANPLKSDAGSSEG